jgi:putative Mg2+ transporter-C (MgtC) family protein
MAFDLSGPIVFHLLLAAVLGGVVGLERQLRQKPAGIRTNMLICFGSALYTVISYQMAGSVGGDHTRIAAQIIPGIGFIGAGVVLRERGTIVGITSAATIFMMASIGMAVGAGMIWTAIFATLVSLAALIALGKLEVRIGLDTRVMSFHLTTSGTPADLVERAHEIVQTAHVPAHRWKVKTLGGETVVEFDAETTLPQERELLTKLGATGMHCEASPPKW